MTKELKKWFELIALASGLSAVTLATVCLIGWFDQPLIIQEPIKLIRYLEIVIGLFSIIFLIKIIKDKII